MREFKVGHGWNLVIWFFWGSVLSLIAFDWSDYLNYLAQSQGHALTPFQQVFYYAIFPTLLYFALGSGAYFFARLHLSSPLHFVEGFLVLVVIVPAVLALFLNQAHSIAFTLTILGGTIASVFIAVGLMRKVRGHNRAVVVRSH